MKKGDFKYYIDNFGYRNDEGRRQAALKDVDEAVEKAELFRPYAEGFDFVGDGDLYMICFETESRLFADWNPPGPQVSKIL